MKIYISDKNKIAFYKQKATAEFWDEHWKVDDLKRHITNYKMDNIFLPQVLKYLPKGATIVEGGCGRGQIVHALKYNGYNPIGIDFAEKTVKAINDAVPDLDVRIGDVRKLDLENDSVDGYISAGVIEHFWDGYDDILSEMSRVIKQGGFLFITFPSISFLRSMKIKFDIYTKNTKAEMDDKIDEFYQFALDTKSVIKDLEDVGFRLIKSKKVGGLKGLKDEIKIIQPVLQVIYNSKYLYPLHMVLDKIFSPFSRHMSYLIMRKT